MPLDLFTFHRKLTSYSAMYLLPDEEQALHIILETKDQLFGEQVSLLSHTARLQLVLEQIIQSRTLLRD